MAKETSASLLDRGAYAELETRLSAVQASYRAATISDVELRRGMTVVCVAPINWRAKFDAWVVAFPRSYAAHLARADFLEDAAWKARGDDTAANTTSEQFEKMDRLLEDAGDDYRESLRLEAKPLLSYVGLMRMADKCGRPKRELIDLALKLDPKSILARRTYMSQLETRWGGSVEKMEAFAAESKIAGITLQQSHVLEAMVMQDRGWTLEQAGKHRAAALVYQGAVEHVDDAGQAGPNWYAQVIYDTGYAYEMANDVPNATPWLRRAVAQDPTNMHALSSLGWALDSQGQVPEAAQLYFKAAELGDPWAMDRYGECLWGARGGVTKDHRKALSYFHRAASAGDEDGERHELWATQQMKASGEIKPSDVPSPAVPADNGPTNS